MIEHQHQAIGIAVRFAAQKLDRVGRGSMRDSVPSAAMPSDRAAVRVVSSPGARTGTASMRRVAPRRSCGPVSVSCSVCRSYSVADGRPASVSTAERDRAAGDPGDRAIRRVLAGHIDLGAHAYR